MDNPDTNWARVYLALEGDEFDPYEVTEFLDIKPTSIMRKGSKTPELPKKSSWEFSTAEIAQDFIDVFEMSASLVSKLKPKQALIVQAIERFDLTPRFAVVVYFSEDENVSTPALGFEVETIQFLGEIGAFVDIDCY